MSHLGRACALESAAGQLHYRHSPTPGSNDEDPRVDERTYRRSLYDAYRRRGWNYSPPALPIRGDAPSSSRRVLSGRGFVIDRSHGLGGIREGRVVGRNHRPRDDYGDLPPPPPLQERVVESLGQQVADLALCFGTEHIERRRRNDRSGHLRSYGQKPNLRSVAVRYDDLGPAALGERDKAARRRHEVAALDLRGARLAPTYQGVAAEGNHQARHPRRSSPVMSV